MKIRILLKKREYSLTRTLVVLVALGVCMVTQVFGADKIWNNPGVGNWSDGANWTGGEPTTGSDVVRILNGGTAVCGPGEICGEMYIGTSLSESGTIRLDTSTASISNMTKMCYLANYGTGTIIQTAGHLYSEKGIRMGFYATGYGRYEMSGGTAVLGGLTVGRDGPSEVFQSGGTVTLIKASTLANGLYELTGGTLVFDGVTLWLTANARMVIDEPTAAINTLSNTIWYIGNSVGGESTSTLEIKQGSVFAHSIYVGHQSTGIVTQTGGMVKQRAGASVALGTYAGGHGIWNLFGGTLEVGLLSSVGNIAGSGEFNMGNASGCGVLTQQVAGAGMTIGSSTLKGTFRGWSDDGSGSKLYLTGPFYNYGRVIADGYGVDRSLDLTCLVAPICATENPTNGVRGWFAQNHGKLVLNSVYNNSFKKVHYWGESVSDTTPDMINSAYIVFTDNQTVPVIGQLYATDRTDVNVNSLGSLIPISVHQFTGTTSAYNLTIRYDHTAVEAADLAEVKLRLYQWSGSEWTNITTSLDTVNRTISATGVSGNGLFAIAAFPTPPPGTVIIIL